ncbi:MAG TPA: NAD(P)H-dependent oxidoreductase [Ilumatobacter sp.]
MHPPRVALLPGSTRAASVNRRLAASLVAPFAALGIEAELIDLAEFPLPLYHGDHEATHGAPDAAVALHGRLAGCAGLVIVSPEYNGGPSPLLKNAIDWVTRVDRAVFRRLVIGLAAASPGSRGGIGGLAVLRRICEHMRLDVVPVDLSIATAGDAFEPTLDGWALCRADDRHAAAAFVAAFADRLGEQAAAAESA